MLLLAVARWKAARPFSSLPFTVAPFCNNSSLLQCFYLQQSEKLCYLLYFDYEQKPPGGAHFEYYHLLHSQDLSVTTVPSLQCCHFQQQNDKLFGHDNLRALYKNNVAATTSLLWFCHNELQGEKLFDLCLFRRHRHHVPLIFSWFLGCSYLQQRVEHFYLSHFQYSRIAL